MVFITAGTVLNKQHSKLCKALRYARTCLSIAKSDRWVYETISATHNSHGVREMLEDTELDNPLRLSVSKTYMVLIHQIYYAFSVLNGYSNGGMLSSIITKDTKQRSLLRHSDGSRKFVGSNTDEVNGFFN
jgi:hypothetical protein